VPRLLRSQRMDGVAKVVGVGCVMRPRCQMPNSGLNQPDIDQSTQCYPKLGMQLGNRWETLSFGIGSDGDSDRSCGSKQRHLSRGSTSLGSRVIKLHGYPMKNYKMTCAQPLLQHLARAETDLLMNVCT